MKDKNAWLVAALTLLLFLLIAAFADLLLDLPPSRRGVLWGGFGVLGVAAARLGFTFFRGGTARPAARKSKPDDVVDGAFVAARTRLTKARKGKVPERPVVLVLGVPASAKS